jgi:hypothetical protein
LWHTLLETHTDGLGKLGVVYLHTTDVADSGTSEYTGTEEFLTEVDLSGLDEHLVTVILLIYSLDESIYFISLLAGTVAKADEIDSNTIFF